MKLKNKDGMDPSSQMLSPYVHPNPERKHSMAVVKTLLTPFHGHFARVPISCHCSSSIYRISLYLIYPER